MEATGMENIELYTSPANAFSGAQTSFKKAEFIIFGVPFDFTSTYRTGARFGPNAIRQASLNLETYSFRANMDVEDVKLHDLGDLHVSSMTKTTLDRVDQITKEITVAGKIPITLGGEHTITLGGVGGLNEISKTAVVSFDAHLDLRDEYMGTKLSHTTFMRRINEELNPAKIIEVGIRAACKEELHYASEAEITILTAQQIRKDGYEPVKKRLINELSAYKNVYLTIDLDVLDPAYAPAVQNPEPDGLETHMLLDLLSNVRDVNVVGCDLVELAPNFDSGTSAIQAAKILFEVLCNITKIKK